MFYSYEAADEDYDSAYRGRCSLVPRESGAVIPPAFLRALTALDSDRPSVLEAYLRDYAVVPARIALAGNLHLIVRFGDSAYDPRFRTKLLVAHHDRAPGSPGALDNGAACFQLAALAARLSGGRTSHNTIILFTDSEESATAGDQGSYSVARALAGRVRSLAGTGEEPPAVFVFDVTGRGTAPVLSTTPRDLLSAHSLGGSDLAGEIRTLSSWASRALRKGTGLAPVSIPVPWSDDLGFALGGVPAVTITLLPRAELDEYRKAFDAQPGVSAADKTVGGYPEVLPPTWARLHGPDDDLSALEEASFGVMERVLDAFSDLRIPRVRRIR